MSKTLTEQWREGTLPAGCYYVLSTEDDTPVACDIDVVCEFMIRDVVEPVPSYDEHNKLRKLPLKCFQLEEDNSALMVINKDMCKEIKHLQEQLKEANEALKCIRHQVKIGEFPCDACGYSMKCDGCWCGDLTNDYLEKWGVK